MVKDIQDDKEESKVALGNFSFDQAPVEMTPNNIVDKSREELK